MAAVGTQVELMLKSMLTAHPFKCSQMLFCELRIVGLTTQFYQGFDKSEAFFFFYHFAVHLFSQVLENEGKM